MLYRITGTVALVKSDGVNVRRTYHPPVEVPEFLVDADSIDFALTYAESVMVSGSNYPKDSRTKFNLTATLLDQP